MLDRWSVLISGFAVSIGLTLAINRLPRLVRPELGENRVLAGLPAFPNNVANLRAYPKKMDAYVIDNFPARPYFISALNYLRYKAGYSGTSRILVGSNGWLFYDDGGHLDQARDAAPLSTKQRQAWVTTLAGRVDQLRSMNAVYVVLSAPVKELIYPEKVPRWARKGHGDAELLEADARAVSYPNLLGLRSTLIKERQTHPDIYTRYESHWTGYGARAAYVALCERLTELGFAIEPTPASDFSFTDAHAKDLARMLGISSLIQPYFPRFQHPIQASLKETYLSQTGDPNRPHIIETGLAGKPTLQITADSFGGELLNFLYPHFSRLIVSHPQDGFYREDLISTYHPDVVILEVVEFGLRHAMSPAAEPGLTERDRIRDHFRRQ
jgi:hypothetical protein